VNSPELAEGNSGTTSLVFTIALDRIATREP
jgi:hypothetical protein